MVAKALRVVVRSILWMLTHTIYRIRIIGREHIPATEIVLKRDFSYSDDQALSKDSEEALLYRDMRSDAVHQLVRRLQAAKLRS